MTFKAMYLGSDGSHLTYAQRGQQSPFGAGTTSYFSDNGVNTICDTSTGRAVCSPAAKPLTGLLSLVRPARALATIQGLIDSHAQVTQSTRSKGQQQCLAYVSSGQNVKLCMNVQGVVTYLNTPDGSVKLTGFTTSVTDADVSAPA